MIQFFPEKYFQKILCTMLESAVHLNKGTGFVWQPLLRYILYPAAHISLPMCCGAAK
jgi:hypothetical protein